MIKETHKESRRKYASAVRFCETIDCDNSERGVESFMRCARCKTNVHRNIFYCSKECQRKDWMPRHKLICGKEISVEIAQSQLDIITFAPFPEPKRAEGMVDDAEFLCEPIGAAVGGYRRTLYLVFQIHALNTNLEDDYLLFPEDGGPNNTSYILRNREERVS
ncbi:hypothetical protein C8J56DRAFT_406710 [Mycena floridula]|nr:hypothetical protein C8J56DRAFT_406710 [Mycena floridula]